MSSEPNRRDAREDLRAISGRALFDIPSKYLYSAPEARPASVLVLFGKLDSIPATTAHAPVARDLDVLLQRRSNRVSTHAGQISFPGGRGEAEDINPAATALREAQEETGLDPEGVEVLGSLPPLPLAVSNHTVTTVLGWWRVPTQIAAVDHAETLEVFRVPVAHLLDPAHRFTTVYRRDGHEFRAPGFDFAGHTVWGFTAMVLDGIFRATGWAKPWDQRVEREV